MQDVKILNPALARYLDPDQAPKFQSNVTVQLLRQLLPLTPPKEKLLVITPKGLGRVLGHKYANIYALGEHSQSLAKDPQAVKRSRAIKAKMDKAGGAQEEPSAEILLVHEFITNVMPQFKNSVEQTFKVALDRGNYQEALEFFQGFAEGFAIKGFNDGKIVRKTRATDLHLKMLQRVPQAKKIGSAKELRFSLAENGLSEEALGKISRLQRYLGRIGYTFKRGRPAKSN